MKHHCHCGLKEQLHKLKAGKLGLVGGILIVGHLLFHVAECLVLPAILMTINGDNTAEAVTSEADATGHSTHISQNWPSVDLTGLDVYILSR